jgi:hypothetical protein
MRTRQSSTFLVSVVLALTALGWTLRKARSHENEAPPALSPYGDTLGHSDPAREVIWAEPVPARVAPEGTVERDEFGTEVPAEVEPAAEEAAPRRSATDIWKSEYAAYTAEQLDKERRALMGEVGREKHAIGLEKLNRGEGVIMARGEKPDDEAFAPVPGTMSVFRSGPDGAGSMLWERVDLAEADHPELFELDAKMRWVNEEWAMRRDASGELPPAR